MTGMALRLRSDVRHVLASDTITKYAEDIDLPSLVITLGGKPIANHPIAQPRTRIGRRPSNDIVLNSKTVSGEHAVLVYADGKLSIEDLGSRNGTFVAGSRVERQELDDAGVVRIGEYTLTLVADKAAMAYEPTLIMSSKPAPQRACLQFLDGARAGETLELRKVVTTLGTPGVCVVSCIRRGNEFAVRFTDGTTAARLNDAVLRDTPVQLNVGDVLEVGSTRLRFLMRAA